jgi:hypothetical protein
VTTKKQNRGRWVIVGNGPWGLWFGRVTASDAAVVRARSVRLYDARNIRYWYGKTGGITSLAAFGPCGPRGNESRMGAPISSTLLLDVKAIHDCSSEAVAAFAAIGVR